MGGGGANERGGGGLVNICQLIRQLQGGLKVSEQAELVELNTRDVHTPHPVMGGGGLYDIS